MASNIVAESETNDKPYKWQLNSGESWRDIANDHVLEAQYSLPGARGIKIYNTIYGAIVIDFNKMRIRKKKIRVQRKSFDDCGQETEWLWYYHGNNGWIEYGQKDSKGSATSLKSCDIEKEYQKKPKNFPKFTAGQTQYEINFKEMQQINLASGHNRRVVRRPKFTALQVKTGKTNLTSSSQKQHVSPGSTKPVWQFEGDSGKWYEFKYRFATDTESSVSSKEIEAKYQANPAGSMTFKAGKYQYMLNFSAQVKHYQWMLHDGSQWLNLNHDSVIETHFCQPGAQGIALFTLDYGRIFLDFDKMEIQGGQMTPYRQTSLSQDETEEYLWYFFENRHWHEYGSQGSSKTKASVTSRDIEQQYQMNPQGSCKFTAGNVAYSLNFSAMTQSNLRTGMQRRARRRPKYNSVIQKTNSLASLLQDLSLSSTMPLAGGFTWQFRGDEGVWREYKAANTNGVVCSVSSDDIEQSYQQNPQGQLQFTAGRFSYTLDFSGMSQFNSTSRKKRDVRRIPSENHQKSSSLQGMALSSATSLAGGYVWQFRGEEGVWTEYKTNIVNGGISSVSSEDIEMNYQQNPLGTMNFTAGKFSYILDFSEIGH
ncbi:UNVERIFIED_CONTAM: hypothetical protein FKN15_029284 [Acipenser sinensis]